jgi:hypothetical protein
LQRLAALAKEGVEDAERMRMEKTLSLFDEDIEPLV